MAAAGVSGGVDEVLRARANARRIKEHYEGTLGVPSELQSLSHLLAHDKDAVFTGLENLPCYNKSSIPAPPAPPAPEPPPPPQPVSRRRKHDLPAHGATVRTSFDVAPSSMAAPTLMPPAPLQLDPCDPDPNSHSAVQTPQAELQREQQQQPLPTIPLLDEQPPEYPQEPGAGFHSPGRVRLPSGLSVDPWRWAPSDDLGQVSDAAAPGRCSGALPHPFATDPGVASLPRPDSRAGTASAASSRQASPSARGHSGAFPCTSQSLSTAADQGRQSYGSGSGSPAGSSVLEAETEGERKYRMAKQRLLSAHDLSPQEWARIGPPQDAADLEKFTARSYSVSVDFDRQTLMPQRVAKPDIFHISADEAHRRQIEADEATLALQAQRRAEMEAEEQAAEAERLARTARRGPRYDALGVRQVDRSPSPVLPRFLDWHPPSVGELQQQAAAAAAAAAAGRLPLSTTRRSLSGGSGAGVGASASASPHGSRCASAARARPETAASAGAYGRQTDALPGADPYVYEDLGDDAADGELGVGAAYGTHPPRRRHHSARDGSFVPTPRPPGVSDAHYAQMVRQQRKWLNAPAQPPRPVSAAPFPAPMSLQYVRPRSSRPPPEGTAAPIPSRVAAAAAALAAASDPANRLNSSLRTVIHQRNPQQLPPRPNSRGGVGGGSSHSRANWAPAPTSSRPASANAAANAAAAASFVAALPGGGGGVNSWAAAAQQAVRQTSGGSAAVAAAQPSSSRPASATGAADPAAAGAGQLTHTPLRGAKRLPWEFREHVAAAAAVGIIPPRLSWDNVDVTPAAASGGGGGAAAAAAGSVRRSSNGMSGVSSSARSRGGSAPPRRHQQQQQEQQARQAVVVGETLPPEGANKAGGEQYLPRKFELREGLVLDGFMGRL